MKTLGPKLPPLLGNSEAFVTLRDYFATIALAEIIVSRPQETAEKKALEAYQIADSMMRQRERAASGLKS
jgi:Mrp family chromosome partitioning ATPase